jgi:hypothetical protein
VEKWSGEKCAEGEERKKERKKERRMRFRVEEKQ